MIFIVAKQPDFQAVRLVKLLNKNGQSAKILLTQFTAKFSTLLTTNNLTPAECINEYDYLSGLAIKPESFSTILEALIPNLSSLTLTKQENQAFQDYFNEDRKVATVRIRKAVPINVTLYRENGNYETFAIDERGFVSLHQFHQADGRIVHSQYLAGREHIVLDVMDDYIDWYRHGNAKALRVKNWDELLVVVLKDIVVENDQLATILTMTDEVTAGLNDLSHVSVFTNILHGDNRDKLPKQLASLLPPIKQPKTEAELDLLGRWHHVDWGDPQYQQQNQGTIYVNGAQSHDEAVRLFVNNVASVGDAISIYPPYYLQLGSKVRVGDQFYANVGCSLVGNGWIEIGDNCMLGPYVQLVTPDHPRNPISRHINNVFRGKNIKIGNNFWAGAGAIILGGVTLGDNVIVGAGSVVTKSFGDNVVIAGNPARVIREIDLTDFDEDREAREWHDE